MSNLDRRSILITGAGTGLGLSMALYLAEKGLVVYATIPVEDQRPQLEAEAARQNVSLRILRLDVKDEESIKRAVSTFVAEEGGSLGVINNAGLSLRGYFEDCQDEEIRDVFEVNLFGAMAVTRQVLPHMRRARAGHLIFVSSVGGQIAAMARTAYCASKFGMEGFAESLFQEVTPLGIKVSLIEPAIIKTERWTTNRGIAKNALNPDGPYWEWFRREEAWADRWVQSSPTTPGDVAKTVYRALTSKRPKLRYVVGHRAKIAIGLRRKMPGELFERLFFGQAIRQVTKGQGPRPDAPDGEVIR